MLVAAVRFSLQSGKDRQAPVGHLEPFRGEARIARRLPRCHRWILEALDSESSREIRLRRFCNTNVAQRMLAQVERGPVKRRW
jgi:hypothetical protein